MGRMRPVRFVALSEDGQAMVLADEVGRLLSLPIDERISAMLRADRPTRPAEPTSPEDAPQLAPRDIQARIRSGESADDVARIAGVPVERVLRYAGPVLQERAMLAQQARRTKLKNHEKNATLGEVVDARLTQHGVDLEKLTWDAYRRDDGTWRIVATWPSGKATATAVWEMDKARQLVTPQDDMAQFLCGAPAQEPARGGHEVAPPRPDTVGHEPLTPTAGRDPIRSGRDRLLASLERPLGTPAATRSLDPVRSAEIARGADPSKSADEEPAPTRSLGSRALDAALGSRLDAGLGSRALDSGGLSRGPGRSLEPEETVSPIPDVMSEAPRRRSARAFYEDADSTMDSPTVPSLAVLRPRRTAPDATTTSAEGRPTKRGPNWDDILFGPAQPKDS